MYSIDVDEWFSFLIYFNAKIRTSKKLPPPFLMNVPLSIVKFVNFIIIYFCFLAIS